MVNRLLGTPKAPDNSAQLKSLAEQEKRVMSEEEAAKRQQAAAQRALRARSSGQASLITGSEVGVARTTLG